MARISDATENDAPLLAHMMLKVVEIAKSLGLENGYRIVTNNGPDSGQEVPHLHFHILGGELLGPLNAQKEKK